MYVLCCYFLLDEAMEVKSSSSISALDAISEAPEEDVDMMSQEDEDFAVYGSRNRYFRYPQRPLAATLRSH